jgi:hypothetical protein
LRLRQPAIAVPRIVPRQPRHSRENRILGRMNEQRLKLNCDQRFVQGCRRYSRTHPAEQAICSLRRAFLARSNAFLEVPSYLRNVWNTVGGEPDPAKSEELARDFRDELTQAFSEAQSDWSVIDRELMKWGIPTMAGGFASGLATAVATGHMSLDLPGAGFVIAGVSELVQAAMKRRAFRKKVPMSVFIDLENR